MKAYGVTSAGFLSATWRFPRRPMTSHIVGKSWAVSVSGVTANTPSGVANSITPFEAAAGAFHAEAPPFGETRCVAQERIQN